MRGGGGVVTCTLMQLPGAQEAHGVADLPAEVPPRLQLRVGGMSCKHCSSHVQRALLAVSGVDEATVDLETETAHVRGSVAIGDLIAAVVDIGFTATPVEPSGTALLRSAPSSIPADDTSSHSASASGALLLDSLHGIVSTVKHTISPNPYPVGEHTEERAGLLPTSTLLGADASSADASMHVEYACGGASGDAPARSPGRRPSVAREVVVLGIGGMSCAACVGAVERGLLARAGVLSASVSLMAGSGKVSYDPRLVQPATLVAMVHELGYSAELHHASFGTGSDAPGKPPGLSAASLEAAVWFRQFVGSSLFSIPIFLIAMVLPLTPLAHTLHTQVVPGLSLRCATAAAQTPPHTPRPARRTRLATLPARGRRLARLSPCRLVVFTSTRPLCPPCVSHPHPHPRALPPLPAACVQGAAAVGPVDARAVRLRPSLLPLSIRRAAPRLD